MIARRIEGVRSRIACAAQRSGRNPDEVSLLAVTKTVRPGIIAEAVEAGQPLFGENYAQEAGDKIPSLARLHPGLIWHFIGHLQTNKAGLALELFDCIETLDNVKLAEALDRRAKAADKRLPVLIQVNIGEDPGNSGVSPGLLPEFLTRLADFSNLDISGLMTITPLSDNPEDARCWFRSLRELRDKTARETGIFLRDLSMGMSHDFELAVEEGATIVRVGSEIFGPRGHDHV